MCQNRNSSVASDLVYHEEYRTINNSIPTNATSNWFARASVTQYTNIYVLVRNSKDYNVRIPSIIPTPYYTDRTKYLQYNAEQATGVKGWKLVRFLPHTSSTWYTGNYFTTTNMEVNASLGTAYDYTNEFMVPFGTYDEIWFGTYDMRYWVHTYKTSVLGNYSDAPRNVISSSENPNPHTIEWYNRTGVYTYDPVITHINYGDTGFLRLYVEDTYTAINAIPQNGGMCVFVRNSLNPVSEYSYDTEYKILKFEHSKGNENQTEYIIDFPVETECDILVVGGGGGGGTRFGGGGGAGLLIYKENQKFNGTVVVKVGKGGLGAQNGNGSKGNIGMDSVLISNVETLIAKGGGGGGHESVNGDDGGSGGGGSYPTTDFGGKGSGDKLASASNDLYEFGNDGADGYFTGSQGTRVTGGGGGAGGPGKGTMLESPDGGIGRQYSISGIPTYYAGGGGGANSDHDTWGYDAMGIGGLGGGGNGGQSSPAIVAEDGEHGTGGGGGGGYLGSTGGDGGSGIVIIKYKDFATPDKMVQWTYKSENTDVYTMNNVAIKKEYATSTLDVNGDITATDKNFKIYHPLGYNKWLYHSSIEAPRYDNIYRGKKTIINGVATVDIDKECNETGGMSQGTFVALNRNPQLYLRNNKTFDKVKGEIIDGKIKIYSENTKDKIEIDWMVMAERQDNNIKQSLLTNNDGNLICEKNRILY